MRRSNRRLEFEIMESRQLLSTLAHVPHHVGISADRIVSVGNAFGQPTIPTANVPISGTVYGGFTSHFNSRIVKYAVGGNVSPLGGVNGAGVLHTNNAGANVLVLANPEGRVAFRIGRLAISSGFSGTAAATVVKTTGIYAGVHGSGTVAFSVPPNANGLTYYSGNQNGVAYGGIQLVLSLNP